MMRNGIETGPVNHSVKGVDVTVEVSPCSWMNPTYGLQLQFKLPSDYETGRPTAGCFEHLKKPWAEVTRADYDGLVQQTLKKLAANGLRPCAKCGEVTWNPALFDKPGKPPRCEACFMRDLEEEVARDARNEAARVRSEDRVRARDGFTHRVDAWLHPAMGDDRPVSWYVKGRPPRKQIEDHLASLGSEVRDDYTVVALNDATVG